MTPPRVYWAAMIGTLILLSFPAFAPVQDDPARDALKRLQDVLSGAKTVTLRARTECKAAGELITVTSTALFKDSRVLISGSQKVKTSEHSYSTLVQGDRLYAGSDGHTESVVDVPREYPAELRRLIVLAGVLPVSALTQSKIARGQIQRPEKLTAISDLKLSSDARSLSRFWFVASVLLLFIL